MRFQFVFEAAGLRGPRKQGIAVEVDDVDAVDDRLRAAGVRFEHELGSRPWGTRELVVLDPDGNAVTFFGR